MGRNLKDTRTVRTSVLGNGKAHGNVKGLAMNCADMNSLAMKCQVMNCLSADI